MIHSLCATSHCIAIEWLIVRQTVRIAFLIRCDALEDARDALVLFIFVYQNRRLVAPRHHLLLAVRLHLCFQSVCSLRLLTAHRCRSMLPPLHAVPAPGPLQSRPAIASQGGYLHGRPWSHPHAACSAVVGPPSVSTGSSALPPPTTPSSANCRCASAATLCCCCC